MPQLDRLSINLSNPNIVVPATDVETLSAIGATGDETAPWDIVELRLDRLDAPPAAHPYPLLLTPRHPDEGGTEACATPGQRAALWEPWLPFGAALDIEIAHADSMASGIELARAEGLLVILSSHDFTATPSADELADRVQRGADLGADVVKIATRAESAGDLARLLDLFERFPDLRLAVMGMGAKGMVSRLAAASCGSALNYAAHGEATVEGQWPAREFRALLERLGLR